MIKFVQLGVSSVQVALHPSHGIVLPSSHCSLFPLKLGVCILPSPQTNFCTKIVSPLR
ncbi:MAG: hypothetical protein WCL02_02620 [bacterium]